MAILPWIHLLSGYLFSVGWYYKTGYMEMLFPYTLFLLIKNPAGYESL